MKRLSAIILSALIFFSFYACSQDDHKSETTQTSSNTSTTATERNGNEEDIETTPDESQMLAILDSVSTLIDVDILYDEEYHRCYNFINEVTGYFFQFKILGSENRLAYLLKTEDGGKTWAAQDIQTHSTMGWRERIICAKMLDEKVGLISGKFWADENFSDHTYITTDGGKIWTKIVLPKNSPYVNSERSSDLVTYLEGEAYDLTYEDGVYFLHVRASNYDPESDSQYYYLSYSSTDLTNWTFVETDNTENDNKYIFNNEKSAWHDSLLSVLSRAEIYDPELNVIGSFAAGLMDLDFDNTPEVILAYNGGSMGNVPLEIYDLNTGEKLGSYYSFSRYDGKDNVYLCVAQKGDEYVIIEKSSIRITGADYVRSIGTVKADRNSETDYLQVSPLFSIGNEGDITTYKHMGQIVDKAEYDVLYQQFLADYAIVEETQLQLIKWESLGKLEWKDFGYKDGIDPESHRKLAEKMVDALINSSQQFIKYDIFDNAETNNEIAVEMYKETLYDFMNGLNPFETVDWILNSNPDLSFAIVDMNGDGFSEVIIYSLDNIDNLGEHVILSYVSGEPYLRTAQFGFRAMYNIRKDGTFSWNRSAGLEYGASKLEGSSLDYVELYWVRSDGTDAVEFFIGDQKVTSEEFNAFSSQFSNERAEFYELTEENIEKYVTSEIFNTETEIKAELSEKYPDVPKAFDKILDAYVEIAYLNRYEAYLSREMVEDAKYPEVTSAQLDCIFNSLMDGWHNGGYGYYAGYAAKDINGDGIGELFLTDVEYSIYAMFTLVNGEIVSHYFDFSYHKRVTRIDANGNFYYSDYGKGESEWYEISRLGADGNLYRTIFGHYDMTGFGDPEVYNYYCAPENSLIEIPNVDGDRLTDEEYNNLVVAYNKAVKKLEVNGHDPNEEAIKAIGLEFHQVIIEDQRK